MKIQLIIILGLFVVATLARNRDEDDENQVGRRRHFRGRRRNNDNQIAADAEDAELEDTIPSEDETVTETDRAGRRRGCGNRSRKGGRRGGHRHHESEHDHEWQQRNGDDVNEGERKPFVHDPEWHENHGRPMPDENSETERNHHRHHKHHHHNRNRTTTTTTPSPTTSDPSTNDNEYENLQTNCFPCLSD